MQPEERETLGAMLVAARSPYGPPQPFAGRDLARRLRARRCYHAV
jgi:hypothetical protein